jgi:hypothetical protein
VKRTTGGTFDRTRRFAYFAATGAERHFEGEAQGVYVYPHRHVLIAVNELTTKASLVAFQRLIDQERHVLLDSGIYNLAMQHARKHSVHMDVALSLAPAQIDGFSQLRDLYYAVATKYADRLWGVIEMDQGGAAHKPTTRAMIERDTGIVPMPVWHPLLDGRAYYDTLLDYDRICVGNLVMARAAVRVRLLHMVYELSHQHPQVWHHLLGVTSSPMSFALGIYGSCDSSSWLAAVRWPQGWKARSAGRAIGNYGPPFYYSSDTYPNADEQPGRSSNYYRGDGIALLNVMALEDAIDHESQKVGAM